MINEIRFEPNPKQFKALQYLKDDTTSEVLYGGAASGGKSFLGCAYIIISALQYPETRWLIGRAKLNTLKSTTLKTFNDILKMWNLTDRFKTNHQNNIITVDNGSEIILKDLFSYPSDPEFDSLGSLEISGCFLDEVNQISPKAYEIVNTRIRYKLKQYGLKAKCLSSCNPSKGWVYTTFYKPSLDDNLPEYRKYIPALATDNPNTEPSYIESLRRASESTRQRLLYGNWDYSDDIDSLFKYEHLVKLKNTTGVQLGSNKYITADIARLGKDTTIIIIWDGLTITEIIQLQQVTTDISAKKIVELCVKYQIPFNNVIIDADGIGGGVIDQLPGVRSFINNSRPIPVQGQPDVYQNLKSQCFYTLAHRIENSLIKCMNISDEYFETICQELQIIKQKDIDKDGKLAVIPKDIMKKILGRSPDFADAIMMRMLPELKTEVTDWRLLF